MDTQNQNKNYAVSGESLSKSKLLRQKGKRATASIIHSECSANNGQSESLEIMLDDLLGPEKEIHDSDNIEWCKWLIAGGKSPSEFSSIGKYYYYFFLLLTSSCLLLDTSCFLTKTISRIRIITELWFGLVWKNFQFDFEFVFGSWRLIGFFGYLFRYFNGIFL
jgi:hypothetical protein